MLSAGGTGPSLHIRRSRATFLFEGRKVTAASRVTLGDETLTFINFVVKYLIEESFQVTLEICELRDLGTCTKRPFWSCLFVLLDEPSSILWSKVVGTAEDLVQVVFGAEKDDREVAARVSNDVDFGSEIGE